APRSAAESAPGRGVRAGPRDRAHGARHRRRAGTGPGPGPAGPHLANEVNSKPFLQMTRESGSARTLSLSVQRPLRFAKFLAGFDEERSDHVPSGARHLDDVS